MKIHLLAIPFAANTNGKRALNLKASILVSDT
jgi:hypothetical protein